MMTGKTSRHRVTRYEWLLVALLMATAVPMLVADRTAWNPAAVPFDLIITVLGVLLLAALLWRAHRSRP